MRILFLSFLNDSFCSSIQCSMLKFPTCIMFVPIVGEIYKIVEIYPH